MKKHITLFSTIILSFVLFGCTSYNNQIISEEPTTIEINTEDSYKENSNKQKEYSTSRVMPARYMTNEYEGDEYYGDIESYNDELYSLNFLNDDYDSPYAESRIEFVDLKILTKASKSQYSSVNVNNTYTSGSVRDFVFNTPYRYTAMCSEYMGHMEQYKGQLLNETKKDIIYGIGPYIVVEAVDMYGNTSSLADSELELTIDLNSDYVQNILKENGYELNDVDIYFKNTEYGYSKLGTKDVYPLYEYEYNDGIYKIKLNNDCIESLYLFGGFFIGSKNIGNTQ